MYRVRLTAARKEEEQQEEQTKNIIKCKWNSIKSRWSIMEHYEGQTKNIMKSVMKIITKSALY